MPEASSTISIVLTGVELAVRVGEHPWEQFAERPSRLAIDLTLTFAYRDYLERHGGYVDYDPLRAFLKDLERQPHVNKLEALAAQILKACFALTPAQRVKLALLKPEIFAEMKGVGLEYDVTRAEFGA